MTERFEFGGEIVWRPAPEIVRRSRLKRFMEVHRIDTFDELLRRSVEDLEWFWRAVLDDLGIEFYEPYRKVVDTSEGIPWTRWCVGGKMNIVHNCLDKRADTPVENRAAVRYESEQGSTRTLTYGDLAREVNRLANALRELGLGKGDVVGLYMPMVPEIVAAFFAIVKIGAIVLPLFSGFGAEAVATRLADAGAKALFTADGFFRRGQLVPMKAIADEAAAKVPSLAQVFVLKHAAQSVPWSARDRWWHELVEGRSRRCETERTEAEDPFMIIYTSGTTGRPKGAVHAHCGFPIKAAQDMAHGLDLQEKDTLYWVTDMGWMMGPWEVLGTTLLGATMLLYDGALDWPTPGRLWQLVERHAVTILGVSPTLVRALMRHGDMPVEACDLSSLRILGSTGEPWNPEPWRWLFEKAGKKRLPIINYSGGTEISGGIVMGNVLTPLKPCAFSGPVPGMAADVVDDQGRPVRGQVGELVVRRPWIGMTRGFWKDRERYLETYWSRFPDVWVHGDWAAVDEDGLWYILGRSDDTIKVAGKRVGPAEIESVLVAHSAISEAAAVAVPDELKGEAIVCFCVLKPGKEVSEKLAEELKDEVARALGKPLRPAAVKFVSDLPKTRNAKVMRRVIRAAYLGQDPGDLSALENPQCIGEIRRAM
ncbi:MAG TPA: AMP-binding protein [Candidatus Acidoferrales bacterium]|nr:AMP-binding protein [Candidatus Acidoferrales bacterium]